MNPVEEAFDDVITSVKEEILKRKLSFGKKSRKIGVSKSQPNIQVQKDSGIEEADLVTFKDFTETDKM